MKPYMKSIVMLAICIVSANIYSSAQDNKVYWVHGLGDNGSQYDETSQNWYVYKHELTATANQGTSIQWSKDNSLSQAGDLLRSYIDAEVASPGKAIVFGHSAGGLVARSASFQPDSRIRAVITAGTPNHGAGIVRSLKNGKFTNVARKAMTKAQISFALGTTAIASLFPGIKAPILVSIGVGMGILGEVGKALGEKAIDDAKKDFSGKAAVVDMDPDLSRNSFLRKLNAKDPVVPIINLYGNEDANRLVRLAGSYMHKEEIDSYKNTTDRTFDETMFPVYKEAITTFSTLEILHYGAGSAMSIIGFWNPYCWASGALNFSAAVSWTSTRRYVQYDIHNDWDSIIGATHIEKVEKWRRFLWWRWCDVRYVMVYENSDGFIPNKSSKMDEHRGPYTRNIEVRGVNHLEMNSHPDMRFKLNEILNGKIYDEVFNPKNK